MAWALILTGRWRRTTLERQQGSPAPMAAADPVDLLRSAADDPLLPIRLRR